MLIIDDTIEPACLDGLTHVTLFQYYLCSNLLHSLHSLAPVKFIYILMTHQIIDALIYRFVSTNVNADSL